MFDLRMTLATHGALFSNRWRKDLDDAIEGMVKEATDTGYGRIVATHARFRETGEHLSGIHQEPVRNLHGLVHDSGVSGGGALERGRRTGSSRVRGKNAFKNAARWLRRHSDEIVERGLQRLAAQWNS